jgi:hypothetical protein
MNDRTSSHARSPRVAAVASILVAALAVACREAPTDARVEVPPARSTDGAAASPPPPPPAPTVSAPSVVAAPGAPAAVPTTCAADSDCVPAACCHSTACVLQARAPQGCRGMMCSMNCVPGTVDCGGRCACQAGSCVVKPASATGSAPQ